MEGIWTMKIENTTQEPKTFKEILLHNLFFWVCTIASIALIITSFLLPPLGEIHPSVVMSTGILFAFASLGCVIKAMDRGIQSSVRYKDTELKIGKKEKEPEEN